MNAAQMAKTAYATTTQTPIRTDRGTEYDAFGRVTHRINAALKRGKSGFSQLAEALHENRKLWTLLAADVSEKSNLLPQQLRAQIFYLSEFTVVHSRKVLNEGADASVLVDINTAIMRGLRQSPEAA